ncbi:RagB/SusD family nutrient uptake outer membrane protein [Pseudoflavitalea sp. X16]|uniref:RagB/SusD family nutrient uptake outer membrane protein n=1 Tax=Paraflavitalea devenefica TaxID=2716334 RepID=UPI00141E0AC2|nr:RagB/SusD family nutrient uptake outer membrane protein [Paraflavitalea devenefica]NII25945.1 RagB/SusD family nutrient uptake outer membrane protein [Paraflavitalea devenefica]
MNTIVKNIYSFSLVICLLLVLGCSKYLDKKPDNIITSDMLWQTRANAEAYLYQVYGYIQTSMDDYTMLGASDESSCSIQGVNVRKMVVGNWNAQSGYWYNWGGYYSGIRQSFVFENNIDKVPATALSDELKQQYKAEVLFLRGWFYWKLLRQYGPFVKLTGTLSLNEDYNKYPRAPFDTCVQQINELMDQAAQGLPAIWSSSANYGRPTKGACLAVKSQLALLAASPLWNGNSRFAGLKNRDGVALAPAQYDANKWKIAADAAKAVIDLNAYKLFTNVDEGDPQFDPYLSCRNVFLTPWNSELVFSTHMADTWQWGHEKRCAPQPGGYNMVNATQNVVDAFYMRNGRTIDDPLSGYTETGFVQSNDPANYGISRDGVNRGYVTGNSNMYVNREPRFYVDIQYNGKPVLPAPTTDDRNYFSSDANRDNSGRAEFYYSGKSGVSITSNGDITGYSVLKNVSPATNIRIDRAAYRPFIHIRYAEILLNYVEALNEYDPASADILIYLNMIRQRAGIPNLETVYPTAAGNQVEMRKWILRERQIELCFESDRYFTLIRRLMMGNPEVKAIYRMNTITNDNGLGFSFAGYYTRTLFQTRYWDDKMYLFPISQDDIDKDNALVQNTGW